MNSSSPLKPAFQLQQRKDTRTLQCTSGSSSPCWVNPFNRCGRPLKKKHINKTKKVYSQGPHVAVAHPVPVAVASPAAPAPRPARTARDANVRRHFSLPQQSPSQPDVLRWEMGSLGPPVPVPGILTDWEGFSAMHLLETFYCVTINISNKINFLGFCLASGTEAKPERADHCPTTRKHAEERRKIMIDVGLTR